MYTSTENILLPPFKFKHFIKNMFNSLKICNKIVTRRLGYTAGPYWQTFESIGPRANTAEVVPIRAIGIPLPCNINNLYLSLAISNAVVYV